MSFKPIYKFKDFILKDGGININWKHLSVNENAINILENLEEYSS